MVWRWRDGDEGGGFLVALFVCFGFSFHFLLSMPCCAWISMREDCMRAVYRYAFLQAVPTSRNRIYIGRPEARHETSRKQDISPMDIRIRGFSLSRWYIKRVSFQQIIYEPRRFVDPNAY